MNIFYLDVDIERCAQFHCDKHVVKMSIEYAQILCTVLWLNNHVAPYKPTHQHHPCVLWANQSLSNWCWLKELAGAVNEEYKYRFNHDKNHKSYDLIRDLALPAIMDQGLTERPQVVPDELKQKDPVMAYRLYYALHKSYFAKWTKRSTPQWFLDLQV